ncbi:MarR family winged helix-turn-helix transcriptional regulator [Falsigemmobacter faecalis]|uniref:MarR family winged helix-turn-helix transcriptional regulator n=1 Tax=Falsigemmobacter faecalis TaxID=2488730 RepID=UPI001F2749EF|nr:MarR family transcriptional regulator [Falsigemmobacter faecalis]
MIHLGRAARAEDQNAQLTPAQWTALRYLSRANTASRTPSAFASFHATTRGTATQTLKALEGKALICRGAGLSDGRAVCYDLTEEGRSLLSADPLRDLIRAVAGLDETTRDCLGQALPKLVSTLAALREAPSFGTCHDCRHFEGAPQSAFCACMSRVLAACDTGLLCVNFNKDAPPKLR